MPRIFLVVPVATTSSVILENKQNTLYSKLSFIHQMKWQFILPGSSYWSCLCEAVIHSSKHHIFRMVGNSRHSKRWEQFYPNWELHEFATTVSSSNLSWLNYCSFDFLKRKLKVFQNLDFPDGNDAINSCFGKGGCSNI